MSDPQVTKAYIGTSAGLLYAGDVGANIDMQVGVGSGPLKVGVGAAVLDNSAGAELVVRYNYQPDSIFTLSFKIGAMWELPDNGGCGFGCGRKIDNGIETKPLALTSTGYGSHDGTKSSQYSIFEDAFPMMNVGIGFNVFKGIEIMPSIGLLGINNPFMGLTVGGAFGF